SRPAPAPAIGGGGGSTGAPRLRRGDGGRNGSPERGARPGALPAPGRAMSGSPLAVAALPAAAGGEGAPGGRGAGVPRRSKRLRPGADRGRRGDLALPQQARVLVRRVRRRARARLPPPRTL